MMLAFLIEGLVCWEKLFCQRENYRAPPKDRLCKAVCRLMLYAATLKKYMALLDAKAFLGNATQ